MNGYKNSSGPTEKTLLAVATFNEMENIPLLIDVLLALKLPMDILVVDDDSPDGTGDYVRSRSESEPRLNCIIRKNERGLGSAVLAAMQFAVDRDYTFMLNMDADFSHSPASIPNLLAAMQKKMTEQNEAEQKIDVAIGSRYISGGKIEGWPLSRKIMSRCINFWARLWLGLKTKDNSGSFRCYRVEKLRPVLTGKITSQGYSFFEEILYRLKQNGATFLEIPITFIDRSLGSSKINHREALKAVWNIMKIGLFRS